MACVIWTTAEGTEYKVPEETPHTPPLGAVNTGRIDWACAPRPVGTQLDPYEVDQHLAQDGIQWGSAIAWATAKIGIKKCSSCAAREMILNHVKDVGWAETLKQIAATFKEAK